MRRRLITTAELSPHAVIAWPPGLQSGCNTAEGTDLMSVQSMGMTARQDKYGQQAAEDMRDAEQDAHFFLVAAERCADWGLSRVAAGEAALAACAAWACCACCCCCCCCASWRCRSSSSASASRLGGGGKALAALAADTIACKTAMMMTVQALATWLQHYAVQARWQP